MRSRSPSWHAPDHEEQRNNEKGGTRPKTNSSLVDQLPIR